MNSLLVLLVAQSSMFVILSCFASDSSKQTRVDVTSACARLRSQSNALLGTRVSTARSGGFLAFKLAVCFSTSLSTFKLVLENLYFCPPHTGCVIMDVLIIENQTLERDNDIVMVLMRVWRSDIIDHAVVEMFQLVEIFLFYVYSRRFSKIGRLGQRFLEAPHHFMFSSSP